MSTATLEHATVKAAGQEFYVDGHRPQGSRRALPVEDLSTGEILCEVADPTPDHAMAVLEGAVAAQPAWGRSSPRHRADILGRANAL